MTSAQACTEEMTSMGYASTKPEGYEANIHQALTKGVMLAGVPRNVAGGLMLICGALGFLLKTWGAIPLYLLAHSLMAYLTWRDPWWPQILIQNLRYRLSVKARRTR